MPAQAASSPEIECATMTTLRTEIPESEAACSLPPTARMKRPIGRRLSRYQRAMATITVGNASIGMAPNSVAEPSSLTLSGMP
ncbi:hypothetical protein D3C80_1807300 [compost metagenome]